MERSGFNRNRAWLAEAFEGNAEVGAVKLTVVADGPQTVSGHARTTYAWTSSRSRAARDVGKPPLDDQVAAALAKGSPAATLTTLMVTQPAKWLRPMERESLDGWWFTHSRTETCDSCRGDGQVGCRPCGGSGKVTCGDCGGDGRVRQTCRQCINGRIARTVTVQRWNGSMYNTHTETVYDNCWNCSAQGHTLVDCSRCNGSRKVRCATCTGSGRVRCDDCVGNGKRLYDHDRWVWVNTAVDFGYPDGTDARHRTLLARRWPWLADRGEIAFAVTADDVSVDGAVLEGRFKATSVFTLIETETHGERGAITSIGAGHQARTVTGILADALKLEDAGKGGDWGPLAERLAGTRILTEALRAYRDAKGGLEQKIAAAQEAVSRIYGPLLGETGAATVAQAAGRGVGGMERALSRPTQVMVWGIVLAAAAAAAAWNLHLVMTTAPEDVLRPALVGLGVAGLASFAGVAGRVALMRTHIRRLATRLQLGDSLKAPAWQSVAGPGVGMAVLTPALALALTAGAVLGDVPAGVKAMVLGPDRGTYVVESVSARTTANLRIRSAPGVDAPVLITAPAGAFVAIMGRDDGEWTLVAYDGLEGYAASRYLAVEGEAPRLD